MSLRTRHLLLNDVETAAAVLARSFAADPVIRWILAVDDDDYTNAAIPFFRTLITRSHRRGHAYTLCDRDTVLAVALWSPPEVPMFGQDDGNALRDALLASAGPGALQRLGTIGEAMAAHHPEQPSFYLGTVGVDPSAQGRGVGASILAPVLDRCDHDGLAAYLESSNPRNVPFYERLGYEVVFAEPIDDGVLLQGMRRTPRHTA